MREREGDESCKVKRHREMGRSIKKYLLDILLYFIKIALIKKIYNMIYFDHKA